MCTFADNITASVKAAQRQPGKRRFAVKQALDNPAAFTLIEVLVSVVILATGIVLILRAFETSLVALAEARDALRATALVHGKLAEIRSGAAVSGAADVSSRGWFEAPYQNFSWIVERRSTGIAKADRQGTNALEEVTVTVQRGESATAYTAATYVRTGP